VYLKEIGWQLALYWRSAASTYGSTSPGKRSLARVRWARPILVCRNDQLSDLMNLRRAITSLLRAPCLYRHIVETYQAQYAPHLADDVRKVIEEVYGQVAVAKIAHSEEMRGLVDREVIDLQMRSPHAVTMAMLGLMSECLIRQKLSKAVGKHRKAA
jgi:hypothetical protein